MGILRGDFAVTGCIGIIDVLTKIIMISGTIVQSNILLPSRFLTCQFSKPFQGCGLQPTNELSMYIVFSTSILLTVITRTCKRLG